MTSTIRRSLILGGARSGKSAHAEKLAAAAGRAEVVYLATAQAGDSEMTLRIEQHRQRRPSRWVTVEEPLGLGDAIREWCAPGRIVLVDCLTVWLSNLMFCENTVYPDVGPITLPTLFHQLRADFFEALDGAAGDLILVSNEVGMGVVPYGAISRRYADEAGLLNQRAAARCEHVVLLAAGLPLVLKGAA